MNTQAHQVGDTIHSKLDPSIPFELMGINKDGTYTLLAKTGWSNLYFDVDPALFPNEVPSP